MAPKFQARTAHAAAQAVRRKARVMACHGKVAAAQLHKWLGASQLPSSRCTPLPLSKDGRPPRVSSAAVPIIFLCRGLCASLSTGLILRLLII